MLPALNDFNWKEAFAYAGEEDGCQGNVANVSSEDKASAKPFARVDVTKLFYVDPGERDAQPWRCAGRLKDKRYFYLEAGCDYTGWDCQAFGWAKVALNRKTFLAMCVPEVVRDQVKAGLAKTRRAYRVATLRGQPPRKRKPKPPLPNLELMRALDVLHPIKRSR
jgi:hypothetical protein